MFPISRRKLLKLAGVAPTALAFSSVSTRRAAAAGGKKTISAVMHSDLRVLDPGITTAYIVRDPTQGTTTEFTKPTGAEVWMPTVSDGPAGTDTVTDEYRTTEPKFF